MKRVHLVIDSAVRSLCRRPYHGHPKGCPNYGKRSTCPPAAPLITDLLDMAEPVYAVYNVFDIGAHVEKMKQAHPDWTQHQLMCCLYWQGTARKQLRERVREAMAALAQESKNPTAVYCPEACGVNVTATMELIGEKLEWPPVHHTYQVAIIGTGKAAQ